MVRDLLDGFTNGDTIDMLRDRLDRLPGDLDEFFQHMLDTIPPMYLSHAARIFDMAKSAGEPQSVMVVSFLEEVTVNPKAAAKRWPMPMGKAEISFRED